MAVPNQQWQSLITASMYGHGVRALGQPKRPDAAEIDFYKVFQMAVPNHGKLQANSRFSSREDNRRNSW